MYACILKAYKCVEYILLIWKKLCSQLLLFLFSWYFAALTQTQYQQL